MAQQRAGAERQRQRRATDCSGVRRTPPPACSTARGGRWPKRSTGAAVGRETRTGTPGQLAAHSARLPYQPPPAAQPGMNKVRHRLRLSLCARIACAMGIGHAELPAQHSRARRQRGERCEGICEETPLRIPRVAHGAAPRSQHCATRKRRVRAYHGRASGGEDSASKAGTLPRGRRRCHAKDRASAAGQSTMHRGAHGPRVRHAQHSFGGVGGRAGGTHLRLWCDGATHTPMLPSPMPAIDSSPR